MSLRPIVRALIVPVAGLRVVSEDERALLTHVTLHGSAGYPLKKLKSGWTWNFRGIAGPPVVYPTKREAVASVEAFLDVLREASGAEAQALARWDSKRRHEKLAEEVRDCICRGAPRRICGDSPRLLTCGREAGHLGLHLACAGSAGPHGIASWGALEPETLAEEGS